MSDQDALVEIVNKFKKSNIQSEAEIRSKLVVPLIELLGYPVEFRAEEFPVYGYDGSKSLNAKQTDFILFDSSDFAYHRNHTEKDCNWVYEHSLLVIETKKSGKIVKPLGQAQFYTYWTKAIGYIETDGKRIIGRFYNNVSKDYELLDIDIDELSLNEGIWCFSYDNLKYIKNNKKGVISEHLNNAIQFKKLNIPAYIISDMRNALGKNADNLSDEKIFYTYIKTTNFLLKNDLRYDVPRYIFGIPRKTFKAKIYADNRIFPTVSGMVKYYCWNNLDRYEYRDDYIVLDVILVDNQLGGFTFGFLVQEKTVEARIAGFNSFRDCVYAKNLKLSIEDDKATLISVPIDSDTKKMIKIKEDYNRWLDEMNKLKEIEQYYEITFRLNHITKQEIAKIYSGVDIIYNGICQQQNCVFETPGDMINEDIIINEPILFEKDTHINIENQIIFGIEFQAYRSTFLPCTLEYSKYGKGDKVKIPCCCEYRVVTENCT